MTKRFLRVKDVMEKVGLRKTAIYDKISRADFPPPIKLGSVSVWVESEIDDWMQAQIEGYRDAG